jgi:hypothetical protein
VGSESHPMLLKHRPPKLQSGPTDLASQFEHLDAKPIAVLRWLVANRVDFVLVGELARAIRGEQSRGRPVAIAPAPYGRNLDRLARALHSADAKLRIDRDRTSEAEVKLTPEKLVRGTRWALRCGEYDIDVEGRPHGVPRYQELLYEANRFELAPELSIEVASIEDIISYEQIRLGGPPPEFRVSRGATVQRD